MQGDQLLQQWKRAKQICQKIIEISKNANLYNKINEQPLQKHTSRQFMSVYEQLLNHINQYRLQTLCHKIKGVNPYILKSALLSMCQELKSQKDIYKLKYLRKIWQAYSDILKRLIHMFAYLNRPFHIKQGRIQQLQKTGVGILVLTLFNDTTTQQYESIYFRQIDRIRRTNDFSNSSILKDLVDMLYKIHLKLIKNISKKAITRYTQFYSHFLKHSKQYYQKKYHQLNQLNPCQYFQQINLLYNSQRKIAIQCFGIGGQTLINKQFSEDLIQKYRHILIKSQKGLKSILRNRQNHTFKIIVEMYKKLTKNIEVFKQQFQEFVLQDIKTFMEEKKNEIIIKKSNTVYFNYMQKIIQKNQEYLQVLQKQFIHLGDFIPNYKAGVQKAFSSVKLPIGIQELLAIYIDNKLKFNSLQQHFVQQNVKKIVSIFMCLQNKDMFLIKYTQKLAKKLINTNPQTVKNHQMFIQSLKLNCGIKFTERVETLVYQYNVHEQYDQIIKKIINEKNIRVDFNVKIFSQGAWPTTNIIEIPIHYFPQSIETIYQSFMYYRENYNNKKTFKISYLESKFRWIYHFEENQQSKLTQCYFETNCLQGALLQVMYSKRPQKVSLSLIQHYFQKIPQKLIKQNLNKMIDTPEHILNRYDEGNQTFYQFNSKMRSTKRLINYESGLSGEQQKLFQQQDLGKDRQIVLDANIAKFMKSRKVTDFQTLFGQISKMIKTFNPQKKDIKLAIQRLITKQLLQRDEKDVTKVKYIE